MRSVLRLVEGLFHTSAVTAIASVLLVRFAAYLSAVAPDAPVIQECRVLLEPVLTHGLGGVEAP